MQKTFILLPGRVKLVALLNNTRTKTALPSRISCEAVSNFKPHVHRVQRRGIFRLQTQQGQQHPPPLQKKGVGLTLVRVGKIHIYVVLSSSQLGDQFQDGQKDVRWYISYWIQPFTKRRSTGTGGYIAFRCLCSINIYVLTVKVRGTGIKNEFCLFKPKLKYLSILNMRILATAG